MSIPMRASTQRGKKWHLWIGRGKSACGAKVTQDTAPFDPASAHSCQLCVRSMIDHERELPNEQIAKIRQLAAERAKLA